MTSHNDLRTRFASAFTRAQELLPRIALEEAVFQLYRAAQREQAVVLEELCVDEGTPEYARLLAELGLKPTEPRIEVPGRANP